MIETSIIIPVRNQKDSLLMALDSLKRQIKKKRLFEIIVCDDGSTDGTGEAVRKLRLPIFLKYIKNDPPLGRAGNRNLGFKKSVGKHLIFFDGDMVPASGFIEALLDAGDSNIVRVGSVQLPPKQPPGRLEKYLYSRGRLKTTAGNSLSGRYFTSNNFYISRDNFIRIGGFDDAFKGWGGEDIDFGLALESQEIPIKHEPQAVTYHYHRRTVQSIAADFYAFGAGSFAHLLKKQPHFLNQIPARRLGLAKGLSPVNVAFNLLSVIMISRPVLRLAEILVSGWQGFFWPDFAYDYIFWGNLALGYKQRPRERN